jgi:hypothetical protein
VASACSQPPAKTDLGGLGGQESLSSLRREGNKPSVGFLSPVPNSKRVGQHWHSCTHSWYPSLLRNNKPRKAALAKFVLCSDSFNFLFYLVFFFFLLITKVTSKKFWKHRKFVTVQTTPDSLGHFTPPPMSRCLTLYSLWGWTNSIT